MTAIKQLQMTPGDRFTDNYGGVYPHAIIIINNVTIDSRSDLKADLETLIYDEDGVIKGMAYSVNFWYEKVYAKW